MPLKRDPSLVPLSHDHHHGLVRVFEIRQALRSGGGLEAQAAATREHWNGSLAAHFEAEEQVVFPLLRAAPESAELVARLCDEHRQLRRMVEDMAATPASLEAFADLLERHIRLEERQLFAVYQARVPEGQRPGVEVAVRRILGRPADDPRACDLPRRI